MDEDTKKKWFYSFWFMIISLSIYSIINHLNLSSYTLPLLIGEEKIPFLPSTFFVYGSLSLQFFIVVNKIDLQLLKECGWWCSLMILFSFFVFIVFPVSLPQYVYGNNNSFVFNTIRFFDTPLNCFPSLHVSFSIFLSFCFSLREQSFIKKSFMYLWSTLIIISVLTIKQHYIIDILGGIVVALFFIRLCYKDYKSKYAK